jgi:hypothetical protein
MLCFSLKGVWARQPGTSIADCGRRGKGNLWRRAMVDGAMLSPVDNCWLGQAHRCACVHTRALARYMAHACLLKCSLVLCTGWAAAS